MAGLQAVLCHGQLLGLLIQLGLDSLELLQGSLQIGHVSGGAGESAHHALTEQRECVRASWALELCGLWSFVGSGAWWALELGGLWSLVGS